MTSFSRAWVAAIAALAGIATFAAAQRPDPRPLSLEEAIGLAVPESETIALSRLAVDRARGDEQRARSALFPQITGSLAYARQLRSQFAGLLDEPDTTTGPPAPTSCDAFAPNPSLPLDQRIAALEDAVECTTIVNPFGQFSRLPFGRENTYTVGLSGSQLLFDGGRVFGQMKAARAGTDAARIDRTAAEAQLMLDVVQAYYDAALSDRLVAIAEATLAQTDTTLAQTELRREVGTAPEFDVLRARVARDNQRPVLINARTRRDLAYVRLKQLLNVSLHEELALTTDLADTTFATVPTLARLVTAAPDTAAEHRAAVRQAELAIEAQQGLAQAARAERWPALRLSSQWTRLAYPSGGLPGWSEFVTDWQVTLGVQVPIFTGGRIKGARAIADADVGQARLRHRQVTEAAQLDARDALAALEAASAAWRASEGTAEQAQRAYEIADLRFREGISTQTELLDARIALQQAEVNRAQAARDLQVARVRVAILPDLPLTGATSAIPAVELESAPQPVQPTTTATVPGQARGLP